MTKEELENEIEEAVAKFFEDNPEEQEVHDIWSCYDYEMDITIRRLG